MHIRWPSASDPAVALKTTLHLASSSSSSFVIAQRGGRGGLSFPWDTGGVPIPPHLGPQASSRLSTCLGSRVWVVEGGQATRRGLVLSVTRSSSSSAESRTG